MFFSKRKPSYELRICDWSSDVVSSDLPPSPRNVTPDQAAALAAQVPGHVAKVGVFVDPDDALLDAAIAAARLDGIQLHKAAPQRTAEIRAPTRREIWTAIPAKPRADLDAGRRHRQSLGAGTSGARAVAPCGRRHNTKKQ